MSIDLQERVTLLEQQIALLCEVLGVDVEDPTAVVPDEVLALARDGHTVKAIHRMRQLTGAPLVAATELVQAATRAPAASRAA